MNTLDLIALCCVAFFTTKGIFKGLINELFSLLALAAGIAFLFFFGKTVNNWIIDELSLNPSLDNVLFLAQLVLIILLVKYLGKVSTATFKSLSLGPLNRFLGGLFGLLKGLLLIIVFCFLLTKINTFEPNLIPQTIYNSYVFELYESLVKLN